MPKKRNISWSRNKKQKQIITAKLIEISLKVEDYVYNHKPISESDAEHYMREVASYKTQCVRDERSLQVIEKLTRCMKAIIIEHQEVKGNTYETNHGSFNPLHNIPAGSVSPVYSLSDEDRTQMTGIAEEKPGIRAEANKNQDKENIEIIDLCDIDDDQIIYNNEIIKSTTTTINVEVDIHRTISKLSLRNIENPPEIQFTDTDFSQSILHNFEDIEKLHQNENIYISKGTSGVKTNSDTVQTTDVCKANNNSANIHTEHIPNINNQPSKIQNDKAFLITKSNKIFESNNNVPNVKYSKAINTKYNSKDKTVVQSTEPTKIIKTIKYMTTDFSQNENTQETNTLYSAARQTADTQEGTCDLTWSDAKTTSRVNSSSHSTKDPVSQPTQTHNIISNRITDNNSTNFNVSIPTIKPNEVQTGTYSNPNETLKIKLIDDSTPHNVAIVNENSTTTTSKKKRPRKYKADYVKEIKPKNKTRAPKRLKDKNCTNIPKKDPTVPIYHTNVENDLSWLENIRYVREIRVDENDTKLNLEETFWDNYYFPANWNDSEFM